MPVRFSISHQLAFGISRQQALQRYWKLIIPSEDGRRLPKRSAWNTMITRVPSIFTGRLSQTTIEISTCNGSCSKGENNRILTRLQNLSKLETIFHSTWDINPTGEGDLKEPFIFHFSLLLMDSSEAFSSSAKSLTSTKHKGRHGYNSAPIEGGYLETQCALIKGRLWS
ncbi:hypothetical protein CHS0354_021032 [Potamilus streckersoni]|uniref:Uncharacterized protein n=1 Tax=Potamilus streckersoni TaxID=2493646 RepID=A0AAE0VTQ5_9BIVA|nr:hypothetical protein CHS0354_021032 [Potamilus streckersoni]